MSRTLIYLLALVGLLGTATIGAGATLGDNSLNAIGVTPVRTNNLVNMLAQKEGGGAQIEQKGEASGLHPTGPITSHPKGPITSHPKGPITSHPLKNPIKKPTAKYQPGECPFGRMGSGACWKCTVGTDGASCNDANGRLVCTAGPCWGNGCCAPL